MQTKKDQPLHRDFVFGTRPVMEALEAGEEINKILLLRDARSENVAEILALARAKNIPYQRVPQARLNRVTRKNHQGAIAFISPIRFDRLDMVIPGLFEAGENPLVVVLDQVTDVRNFGAICRSAECLGAQAVVIPKKGGAAVNSDAVKTSAGALFNLKVCRVDDLKEAMLLLQQSGLQIVACTEKSKQPLQSADFTVPTAVLLGAEDVGISPPLLKRADQSVRIPMTGQTNSLNVAVSAGVVLYECLKQRLNVAQTA